MEEDPVIREIPVYLSQALADNLHLLQYPLRPAYMPYDGSSIASARVKPNQGDIELDVAMETRGPHYSRSRGEQYARKTEGEGGVGYFKSGLMDCQTLSSSSHSHKTDPRYVGGVLKDGELHLTPLKAILQLRPTLRHIEMGDAAGGSNRTLGMGGVSDGDTTATESEEEEAKPVTVKFARGGAKHKAVPTEPEEAWHTATYHSIQSVEATDERQLLFGMVDNDNNTFTCTPNDYLDIVCPVGTSQQSSSPCGPSDVLSLSKLKTLPLERQVVELMKKAMLLQFDRVCTILGRVKQERETVMDDLQKCAVLVQGCWVVHSSLVMNKEQRNARDYILWCFTKSLILARKDLSSILKITSPQLHDLLRPVSAFKAGSGWHFKQTTDNDFIAKYPSIVESQKLWWEKRHKEIVIALGIGVSPESSHTQPQSGCTTTVSGQKLVATASQKSKDTATPIRQHLLSPNQIMKQDSTHDTTTPSSLESIPDDVLEDMKKFITKSIGRGVASIDTIKNELLSHVLGLPDGDALKQHGSVSDSVLVSILSLVGVVNVGEPHGRQLYAVKSIGDKTDTYRDILLVMFNKTPSFKRKQLTEEINKQQGRCDSRLLTSTLKDICVTKQGGVCCIKELE